MGQFIPERDFDSDLMNSSKLTTEQEMQSAKKLNGKVSQHPGTKEGLKPNSHDNLKEAERYNMLVMK